MSDLQTDQQTALFANDAFYAAFAAKDPRAMAALWSETTPVTCLHPGWPPLKDLPSVLKSWTTILSADGAPDIECRQPEVFLTGDMARVICFEVIGNTSLLATNIFIRENGGWSLIHHQASPTTQPPAPDDAHAFVV